MLKKDTKDKVVTIGYLDERLNKLIVDLIKEERAIPHEALMESLENAKVYHERETEKYIKVLMDEWKDESRRFHDYMKGIKDTQDDHGKRISGLDLSFR